MGTTRPSLEVATAYAFAQGKPKAKVRNDEDAERLAAARGDGVPHAVRAFGRGRLGRGGSLQKSSARHYGGG